MASQYFIWNVQENPPEITCLAIKKPLCLALSRPWDAHFPYINNTSST